MDQWAWHSADSYGPPFSAVYLFIFLFVRDSEVLIFQ